MQTFVSYIFVLTLALYKYSIYRGNIYVTLMTYSTFQCNTGVIIGSHVFLISQPQINGRGPVLPLCLPPPLM